LRSEIYRFRGCADRFAFVWQCPTNLYPLKSVDMIGRPRPCASSRRFSRACISRNIAWTCGGTGCAAGSSCGFSGLPWQCLYFLPLPQGQSWFRPIFTMPEYTMSPSASTACFSFHQWSGSGQLEKSATAQRLVRFTPWQRKSKSATWILRLWRQLTPQVRSWIRGWFDFAS